MLTRNLDNIYVRRNKQTSAAKDTNMHNEEETNKLLSLQKRLMDESDMIGWLCTVHRNAVRYSNSLNATKKIQE